MTAITPINSYAAPAQPSQVATDANETNNPTYTPPEVSDSAASANAGTASDQSGSGAGNGTYSGGNDFQQVKLRLHPLEDTGAEATLRTAITEQAQQNSAGSDTAAESAEKGPSSLLHEHMIKELKVKSPQPTITNLVEVVTPAKLANPDNLTQLAEGS